MGRHSGPDELNTASRRAKPPANFKEWIHATFGAGLAEVFLEPYNFKVWAQPLEQMNYQWIGERVAVSDLERVIKNVIFETGRHLLGTEQYVPISQAGRHWSSLARGGRSGRQRQDLAEHAGTPRRSNQQDSYPE